VQGSDELGGKQAAIVVHGKCGYSPDPRVAETREERTGFGYVSEQAIMRVVPRLNCGEEEREKSKRYPWFFGLCKCMVG
jgi:hypothetical protein